MTAGPYSSERPGAPSSERPSEGLSPFGNALLISVGLHLTALLLYAPAPLPWSDAAPTRSEIDLTETMLPVASDAGVLALESFLAPETQGDDVEAKRHRVRKAYLEAVEDAVHAHRLDAGDETLIGLTLVAFEIARTGALENARLVRSSGDPNLDRAALRAVANASGEVKRPALLGDERFLHFMEVRYQYALR